ncbi:unnamed protein product [Wickerhamomyces anomalus]
MNGESKGVKSDQFPVNLQEGLGVTPLTYLIPTQDRILTPISPEINEEEGCDLYQENVKAVFESNSPSYDSVKQNVLETYSFSQCLENSTLSFRGTSTTIEDETPHETKSLFDGLHGLAKNIVDSVPLVSHKNIVSSNKDAPQTVTTSRPNPKRTASTLIQVQNEVEIKKRKSDIGVQHLQLESISNQKLTDFVVNKIGLADEQCEYESSDLWIELPSSEHVLSLSFEVLDRLKKLSVRSIKCSENFDWADVDLQSDFWPLKIALNSLKAVTTILIIYNCQRKEKKLYLDEDLVLALDFIYKLTEDLILKLTVQSDEWDNENVQLIIGVMNLLTKDLELFGDYIASNQANDTVLTKLEYLSLMIFFHAPEEKQIHHKLPTHKTQSRQLNLFRGLNIQFFTALILNFIQSLNIRDIELKETIKEKQQQNRDAGLANSIEEDNEMKRVTEELQTEKNSILALISSTLVNRIITQLNANTKQLFELFIQDLLNVVQFPEWSASEQLLSSLTNTLVSNSENQPSIVETYLLEIIGLIGSTMLELKGPNDLPDLRVSDLTDEYSIVSSYLLTLRDAFPVKFSGDSFVYDWIYKLSSNITSSSEEDYAKAKERETYLKLLSSYYREQSNVLIKKNDGSATEENATLCYKKILLSGTFMKLYHNFLTHLLRSIDHPKIKSRTRAMKNLAQLIDKDSRLLNLPMVKQSLSNRIADPSPLVRLAVLEIFDQYILKKPELIGEFYQTLILTNDKSVSVRTKSLKIAKRIFLEASNKDIKVFALEKILRRLEDDEENVLDLTKQLLMETVFLGLYDQIGAYSKDQIKQRDAVSFMIDILLDLINKSEKTWELFEKYLNEDIMRKTDENKKFHNNLLSISNTIVDVLLTFVVDYVDTEKQDSVEKSLGLLSIFSKCEHPLINQEQLMSLQPYLTSESTVSSSTSYYTLVIFRHTLGRTNSYRDQFLTDSQTSLLRRLTKFNTRELDEAMPCIWMISTMKKDTTKISNAAASCLTLIKPNVDKALKDELDKSDPKVLRLIYLIGSFGKYCDLEANRQVFKNAKKLALKEKESVLSLITKYLLIFTRDSVNRQIRRVAVRNIINVCSSHPKLFMSSPVLNVLDKEFTGSSIDFKEVMIQGIFEFLEREEKKSSKRSGHEGKISSEVSLDVDVFHGNSKMFENDGICASLVQRYMDPILEMCTYDDGEHSYLAVKYLKFIVKLGFANPRICIPTVVALEASKVPYVRSMALEIHRELHSKHESLIDSSYIHGFKLAVKYRAKLSSGLLTENQQYFQKFYKVIEESKATKKKIFNQLVKSFTFSIDGCTEEQALFMKNYVLFMANTIPCCELSTLEEVFILVDGIDAVLANQGVTLSSNVSVKLNQTDPNFDWKIYGYLSLAILSLYELKNCLIQAYKIPEDGQRNELKSQKTKFTEVPIKLFDISPEAGSFRDICEKLATILL